MKVLVSGDLGFVGRHYVKYLCELGHEVHGFDINMASPKYCHENYSHFWADARQYFATSTQDGSYDAVVHLAAIVGGRTTIDNEPLKVATDLAIDAMFFNWCYRESPAYVIYFSSSAAYGVALQEHLNGTKLKEDHLHLDTNHTLLMPDMTYGWSKLTGEYLASHLQAANVNVHVFRPFSGYGSDQGSDYPFGAFIDRALKHDDPFEIWGNGKQQRDWIHIDDVVEGSWTITLNAPADVYNMCTGVGTNFTRLSRLATEAAGYEPKELKFLLKKPTGVLHRVGDPHKMFRYYYPKVTLREGIERAVEERKQEQR